MAESAEIGNLYLPHSSHLAGWETAEPDIAVNGHVMDTEAFGGIPQGDGFHGRTLVAELAISTKGCGRTAVADGRPQVSDRRQECFGPGRSGETRCSPTALVRADVSVGKVILMWKGGYSVAFRLGPMYGFLEHALIQSEAANHTGRRD